MLWVVEDIELASQRDPKRGIQMIEREKTLIWQRPSLQGRDMKVDLCGTEFFEEGELHLG